MNAVVTSYPRPEIEEFYATDEGVIVEVLAISSTHVVCDQERVYTREDFSRLFIEQDHQRENI